MTPELREHIAAFTADCAADGLGYLGRHRRDHAGISVTELRTRLGLPCRKCNGSGWLPLSHGVQRSFLGDTPLPCRCGAWSPAPFLPSLPVVASPPRPSTGEGKGRPIEFGSVDRPTTQT